jgi:hypothetical protein
MLALKTVEMMFGVQYNCGFSDIQKRLYIL